MADTSTARIATVCAAAAVAATTYGRWSGSRRTGLLARMADELEDNAESIIDVVHGESHLPVERLAGELARTTGQLRLLGQTVATGGHLPYRHSTATAPTGQDIHLTAVPLGVVAVFAASNFPLAFGVPGGDTGSALAAGCSVVIRAHPAQPDSSRILVECLRRAVTASGAPPELVGFVEGGANEVSLALVRDPHVAAVGFTGSLSGGRALMDAAATRPRPIPVYAEMGSLNPVFVLPGAASETTAAGILAASVTGSGGQLCTKPGLIVFPDTTGGETLRQEAARQIVTAAPVTMLTERMARAHDAWYAAAAGPARRVVASTATPAPPGTSAPFAVLVDGAASIDGDLLSEHFGPTTVLARVPIDDYLPVIAKLEGTLTATLFASAQDQRVAARLLPALARIAGRVIWNAPPTGVAVCEAMMHGGPWPASSVPWATSVGTESIKRFQRPLALQGVPAALADTLFE